MTSTPAWRTAATHTIDGQTVTLSEPRLVYRTRSYNWFPSLFAYGDGELAAMLSAYGDIHVSSSAVRIARSKDGGLTWTEPFITVDGGFDGVVLPNGDLFLLPYYMRSRPDGMGSPANIVAAGTGALTYDEDGVVVTGWPRPDRSYAPKLDTRGFVFNGQPVTLHDGRWLMTLYGYFEEDTRLSLVCAD